MPEGSDDSAESRGAQQSLYAGARNERNADSLCVTRELTAATNSESGHKHIAQRYLWRVCDRREQSRFPASPRKMCVERSVSGVQHTSGEDRASSNDDKVKPYRGAKALDSLSGACERQGVTARATRPKGIESAAIERRVVVHIRTDVRSVGCGKWTAKAVRGARMRERGASLLTSAAHHSGGLFGQAHGITVISGTNTAP